MKTKAISNLDKICDSIAAVGFITLTMLTGYEEITYAGLLYTFSYRLAQIQEYYEL